MRLNSLGSATYGLATVAIDGAIPAALSAVNGPGEPGPRWLTDTTLFYQDNAAMHTYDTGSHAVTTVSASGSNWTGAGSSVWAKSLASGPNVGVLTSVGGLGPFPAGTVAEVSPDGEVALFTSNGAVGLTVYAKTGATLLALPSVTVTRPQQVRIRNHILAYVDVTGWHLVNVLTGATPPWFPRIDNVSTVVPFLVGSILWVAESGTFLSLRKALSSRGYTLETLPIFFNPDAMNVSSGVARVGYCANQGESASSLLEIDVTVQTGATVTGAISGTSIVRVPGPTLPLDTFNVGPQEGTDAGAAGYPPGTDPVANPRSGLMTDRWFRYQTTSDAKLAQTASILQHTPAATPPSASFSTIQPDGTPNLVASSPLSVLTVTSADTSVIFGADPLTNTLDLSSRVMALKAASYDL